MEAPIEPPPCSSPFSTRANGCHYYWRGAGPGQASTAIAVFCSRTEQWSLKPTTGPPPPGEWCGCSVHVDGYLYTFGGSNGTSRVNDMSKLDLDSFQWIQLQSSGSQPLKKTGCGLVCVNDRTLCCFGGFGIVPKQPESTCTTNEGELRSTNELHFLDVQTGIWSSPEVKGVRPPPCEDFTFTNVDQYRAVLFGGRQLECDRVNDVYLFNFKNMEVVITKVEPVRGEPWPVERSDHAACCLNYGDDHSQMLVYGGVDNDLKVLGDMWILDVDTGKWTEVIPPELLTQRYGHSTTATSLGPGLTEVLVFGGRSAWKMFEPHMSETTLLRFELTSPSAGNWALVDVAYNDTRSSTQRLREKRIKIRQATARVALVRESSDSSQDRVRILEQQLQAAECREHDTCEQLLQEKDRELIMKDEQLNAAGQEANHRCTDAERRVQELTTEMERIQGDLRRSDRRAQLAEERAEGLETQWMVHRREIQLTERLLGGGGWGVVRVAKFRGIEVAAKTLYEQIRSDYYRNLFIREMNMAAGLRHPHLVQFIGATLEGEMIILTELMATSLRRVLEGGRISREHILSISVQVCQALNYLHLMQPDPVIHRDISSANVLLNPLPDGHWRAKVTDYGSVNTLRALVTENPGNPVYAAPEARNPSLQSTKMDIFSLGVLLIEMCSGQFPSDDERERLLLTIQDRHLFDIISRCIDRERDNRPTATELLNELQY